MKDKSFSLKKASPIHLVVFNFAISAPTTRRDPIMNSLRKKLIKRKITCLKKFQPSESIGIEKNLWILTIGR